MRNYRKKCLSISVICFLISILLVSTAFAGAFSFRDEFITARGPVASGKVTLANTRLSLVNGTAFVDFSEANVLTDHVGKYLRVTDAAGKSAWGYIKAAGTGETYTDIIGGTDPHLRNGDFTAWTEDNPDSWSVILEDASNYVNESAGKANIVSNGALVYARQSVLTTGSLIKYSASIPTVTSGMGKIQIGAIGASDYSAEITTTGTKTGYVCTVGTYFLVGRATACNFVVDDVTVQSVLTPSNTGVTITSTAGGSTYNWASIESGFDYNASAGYSWAIYDDATQVLNGSAAEPGVGTRTVTDTENKLSIANGALTFAGGRGTPAYGDPAIWLPAVTREAGRGLISNYTSSLASKYAYAHGWDSAIAGELDAPSIIRAGSELKYSKAVLDTWVSGTTYYFASFLRTSGGIVFAKTDGYWKLWWIAGAINSDPMYPAVSNYNDIATVDFLRIPSTLWLPSPLVSDGFSAWGVSDGKGHQEETGLGSGGSGKTWSGTTWSASGGKALNTPTLGEELATGTLTVGTWYSITATEANHFYTGCAVGHTFRAGATTALDANNKVKPLTLSQLISVTETSTRDCICTVAIATTPAGTQAGLAVGINSATDPKYGIFAYHDGTNAKLDKIVNGVWTSVISAAATWSNNAELRVIRDGTTYRLYYNNVQVGSTSTVADVGDGTLHGLFNTHTTPMDNFTVYARGTNGEFSNLNSLMAPPSSGGGFGIGFGTGF